MPGEGLDWEQILILAIYFTIVLFGTIFATIFRAEIKDRLKNRWKGFFGEKTEDDHEYDRWLRLRAKGRYKRRRFL